MQITYGSIRPAVLILAGLLFVSAAAAQDTPDKQAAKMKTRIEKLGTGKNARVKLQLRNGSIVRGYVSEKKDKTFVVVTDPSAVPTEIEYADARKPDRKLPTALLFVIAGAAVVGIASAAVLISGGN